MIKYITNKILPLLLFSLLVFAYPAEVQAQTTKPGNTSLNVELWLRADEIQNNTYLPDGTNVVQWNDRSGKGRNFAKYGNNLTPSYKLQGLNYNPTVYFDAGVDRNLVSTNFFPTSGATPYFTIFVSDWSSTRDQGNSAYNSTNRSRYATVFSFAGNPDNDNTEKNVRTGWVSGYPSGANQYMFSAWRENNNAVHANASLPYRFGIVGADHSGGHMYHNGKQGQVGSNQAHGVDDKSNTYAVVGSRFTHTPSATYSNASYGKFAGNISEIIVFNSIPGPTELNKIYSYLAIKYGQSLYTTSGASSPYYASNGSTTVWNNPSNYNTGVFGIGRDDDAGLNQKQSMNVEYQKLSIFAGRSLYQSNVENPTVLENGTYLMLGSNGNTNTEAYTGGRTFANGTIEETINTRQLLTYQVQVTSTSNPGITTFPTSVGMQPMVSAEYIMVSQNSNFPTNDTYIYKVSGNVARDITLKNGDFISFLTLTKSPGQIHDGLRMWLKADEPSTISRIGDEVDAWTDFSGVSNVLYKYDAGVQGSWTNRPAFKPADAAMNYHPAVYYRTEGEFLHTDGGVFSTARPEYYTFVSVVNVERYPTEVADNAFTPYILGFGARTPGSTTEGTDASRRPAIGVSKRTNADGEGVARYHEADGSTQRYVYGTKSLFHPAATTILMHEIHLTGTAAQKYILFESDGYSDKITSGAVGSSGSNSVNLTGPGMLGIASRKQRQFVGTMGEVIAYERALTQTEKNVLYSYLGIKYGITLDLDKLSSTLNFDYMLSDKTTMIWPGTSNAHYQTYHNNVAGLVRDDEGGFNNMQARSTDANAIVRIGIGERLGENPILTGLETDMESIMWGNNGTATSSTVSFYMDDDICGQMDSRMSRVWMLDNTRTQQDYSLNISAGGTLAANSFPYYGAGHQVYMMISENANAFNAATGPYDWTIVPGSFTNGEHHFSYKLDKDVDYYYFTFGGKEQAGGACDACEGTTQQQLSFTTSTWPNASLSNYFPNISEITPTVSFSWVNRPGLNGTSRFYTRNPRAVSYNSIRITRTGSTNQTLRFLVDMEKAANATFSIFEIDRESDRYDDVTVYGLCGVDVGSATSGDRIIPNLSYATTKALSSYEIYASQGKAVANRRNSAAFANTGRMYVEFRYPVEQIVVDYNVTQNKSGIKRIGIGPLRFTCPTPPPPVNEDGLSFQKTAPLEVSLCEDVRYTFRINNTNCESKPVDIIDRLDPGMEWVLISIDEVNEADPDCIVRTYYDNGEHVLDIQGLTLPGGKEYTFYATARFDTNETTTKEYYNQAELSYYRTVGGIPMLQKILSCDLYSAYDRCTRTEVTGVYTGPRAERVTSTMNTTSCYRENGVVDVTITLNNPNVSESISQTIFSVDYNEEFTYVPGSLTADLSGVTESNMGMITDTEGGVTVTSGFMFENLTIAASGSYTITFKLRAPATEAGLAKDDVTNEILPLGVEYLFETDDDDICLAGALLDATGNESIPYCTGSRPVFINGHLMHSFDK